MLTCTQGLEHGISMKNKSLYTKENTAQISFPLGGIGTGCIGFAGNGALIDWEIYNSPNKNSFNGYSGFAIKAVCGGELLSARMLNGDYSAPYTGTTIRNESLHSGFGHGTNNKTLAGFPHFSDVSFCGEFPLAEMTFHEDAFPATVKTKAFNPFIPLNNDDSSIPAAFFEIEIENITDRTVDYSVCLFAGSSFDQTQSSHRFSKISGNSLLKMGTDVLDHADTKFGDITLATDADDVSYQEYWYRGGWQDAVEMFWHEFTTHSKFRNRTYGKGGDSAHDEGLLCAHVTLFPKEKKTIRFLIAWSYPNVSNTWNKSADQTPWKNYYATLFESSQETAQYCLENWNRLLGDTEKFKNAIFSSTVDSIVLEAATANLSVLKTATCLRLPNGSLYGFEGCCEAVGCCEGSCTHVWNYAYAVPYLFPSLERSMRENDFTYNQGEDGKMSFRLMLPLGSAPSEFRACVDGQLGGVIKAYREWKMSGNREWLERYWEPIQKSLEYTWSESNPDRWDIEKSGVLTGRQHHTLDMELFGANSWLTGFYLVALKAGAEMAAYLGHEDQANEYLELFEKGQKYLNEKLFNGEYYVQHLDIHDKSILQQFSDNDQSLIDTYWNSETNEIKYQLGEGCIIDQVMPQWHANLLGLGDIFDKEQTKTALKSLYKNNFLCMKDVANTWRLYSLNEESGLIMCSWPEGKAKPAIPITYATETMTGFEYQAACHMLQAGLFEEGLSIVKAIRDRYDGVKRNPWNEIECGSNYARSMASFSLIPTYCGYQYDGVNQVMTLNPIVSGDFRCFFSCETGWGVVEFVGETLKISVLYGYLCVCALYSSRMAGKLHVTHNGVNVDCGNKDGCLQFQNSLKIAETESLFIS